MGLASYKQILKSLLIISSKLNSAPPACEHVRGYFIRDESIYYPLYCINSSVHACMYTRFLQDVAESY